MQYHPTHTTDNGLHPVCLAVYEEALPTASSSDNNPSSTSGGGSGGPPRARLLHATNAVCDKLFRGALAIADDMMQKRTMHDLLSVA